MGGGGFDGKAAQLPSSGGGGVNVLTPIDGTADDTANLIAYSTVQIANNQPLFFADPLNVGFVFTDLTAGEVYFNARWINASKNVNTPIVFNLFGFNTLSFVQGIDNFTIAVQDGSDTTLSGNQLCKISFSEVNMYGISNLTITDCIVDIERFRRIGANPGLKTITLSGRSWVRTRYLTFGAGALTNFTITDRTRLDVGSGTCNVSIIGDDCIFNFNSWSVSVNNNLVITGLRALVNGVFGFNLIDCQTVNNQSIINISRIGAGASILASCAVTVSKIDGSLTLLGGVSGKIISITGNVALGNGLVNVLYTDVAFNYIGGAFSTNAAAQIFQCKIRVGEVTPNPGIIEFNANANMLGCTFEITNLEALTVNNISGSNNIFLLNSSVSVTANLNIAATGNKFIGASPLNTLVGGGAGNVFLT